MSDFEHADDLRAVASHDAPTSADLRALSARVDQTLAQPRRPWGLAAAAVAAVAAVIGWGTAREEVVEPGLVAQPAPVTPAVVDPPAPAVVPVVRTEARTVRFTEDGPVSIREGVRVVAEGEGEAAVDGDVTRLSWVSGRVEVEVDPAAHQSVVVATAEAEVAVVGTVFAVDRGPFGTFAGVTRGRVAVTCASGDVVLGAGEGAWCFRDAGAGLGRVLFMEQRGMPAGERLPVIERALAHPDALSETRQLLLRRRIGALVELGRDDEAVAQTSALRPGARLDELTRRAESAMARGGCAAADTWLRALADVGDVTGALLYVQCLAEDRPGEARRVLDGLAARPLDEASAEAVRAWRAALR